jgi:hypothetical protein
VGVWMFVSPITVDIGSCLRLDTAAINRKLGTIFQVYPANQTGDPVPNSKWKSQGRNIIFVARIMWLRVSFSFATTFVT